MKPKQFFFILLGVTAAVLVAAGGGYYWAMTKMQGDARCAWAFPWC